MRSKPLSLTLALRNRPDDEQVHEQFEVQMRELLAVSDVLMRMQQLATRLATLQCGVRPVYRDQFNWAEGIKMDIADELYVAIHKVHLAVWGQVALALQMSAVTVRLEGGDAPCA